MSGKQIANDWGAWTAGASWQTNQLGNTMSQEVVNFLNGSGTTLYTGDIVIVGSTAGTPDPTAVNCSSTATAASPYVVGVVGGETNMPGAGGAIPVQTPPIRYDAVTVALSVTQPDTAALASDVGKGVSGPGIPLNAFIVSVVPGTSFTMNVAATAAGAATLIIGPRTSSVGPGWLGVPSGEVCPVVITGWAYVNIGGNTVAAGAQLSTSTTARVAAAVSTTTYVASSPGTFIGVALEPQNGPGVITSGDGSASVLVRSWITKF
jgi:hypothetical protein